MAGVVAASESMEDWYWQARCSQQGIYLPVPTAAECLPLQQQLLSSLRALDYLVHSCVYPGLRVDLPVDPAVEPRDRRKDDLAPELLVLADPLHLIVIG